MSGQGPVRDIPWACVQVGFGDTHYPGATPEELQAAIHHAATSARAHPEYIDTEITFLRPHDSGKSADAVLTTPAIQYERENIRPEYHM